MERKILLIFDTNSIIHRAFHALPPLKDKKGRISGAVYGSLSTFFRIVSEINPSFVAVAFDSPGKTFRHKEYKEYKANRPKCPDELVEQLIRIKDIFQEMGIEVLSREGLEADDIVGAVSCLAKDDIETIIVTGDMDILQLVNKKTKAYTLKRGIKESVLYDIERVKEKYDGIDPERIPDIKALQGDKSDNIPGVTGVGEKTAIKIIKEFGSIENLYSKLKKSDFNELPPNLKEKLVKEEKMAFLSKRLATINTSEFSDFIVEKFHFSVENRKAEEAIKELGFVSLLKWLSREEKSVKKEEEKNLIFDF